MMVVNWNEVMTCKTSVNHLSQFADGSISGKQLYQVFAGTENGGTIRSLLRNHGVEKARRLARRAIQRRRAS